VRRLTGRGSPAGGPLARQRLQRGGLELGHPDEHGDPEVDFGKITHDIFMLISWWTLGIFIVVEVAAAYACWRFRDRRGALPEAGARPHRARDLPDHRLRGDLS
jgi:hypothetical protein